MYFTVYYDEYGRFDIQINGELICTAWDEAQDTPGDPGPATYSAVTYATEGKMRTTFQGHVSHYH